MNYFLLDGSVSKNITKEIKSALPENHLYGMHQVAFRLLLTEVDTNRSDALL